MISDTNAGQLKVNIDSTDHTTSPPPLLVLLRLTFRTRECTNAHTYIHIYVHTRHSLRKHVVCLFCNVICALHRSNKSNVIALCINP